MALLFANNASTTLAGSVLAAATTATLATGTGSEFPNPTGSDYFLMTFSTAVTAANREIVKVTARSGDVITMVRAQEGTSAQNWASGDTAANLWTAGSAALLSQISQVQSGAANYAADTGTADAAVVTLSPVPAALAAGFFVRVKKIASQNTGPVTLNVNSLGAKSVVLPDGSALVQGQLPANGIFTAVYDGTNFQIQSGYQTPRSGELFSWPASTPPSYALVRDGSAISRTDYPGLNALADAAGYASPWGPGDGSTTFNLPDDGGLFERGWVSGQSIDAGRGFGSVQAFAVQTVSASITTRGVTPDGGSNTNFVGNSTGTVRTTPLSIPGSSETRPVNRAYLPCICI